MAFIQPKNFYFIFFFTIPLFIPYFYICSIILFSFNLFFSRVFISRSNRKKQSSQSTGGGTMLCASPPVFFISLFTPLPCTKSS
ncbi:unnamed protein product [Meloidogyne enterolobii]|uniref:Uncharacterized protein n=1 Tax=Meloidogyne enterolobii TaxID=390850 RepID=A0ACB0ZZ64_MELEN